MKHLFAYGTLMYQPVIEKIVKGTYHGIPAELNAYTCFVVENEVYPVIFPSKKDSCSGILYKNVSESDFARIDKYEGAEYQRETRLVYLQMEEEGIEADVYCLNPNYLSIVSSTIWDEENFKRNLLDKYLLGMG